MQHSDNGVPSSKELHSRAVEVKKNSTGFPMTFAYEPTDEVPIIKINGTRTCSIGNIAFVVAPSGTGKSQLTETFISSWLNPYCDRHGIEVNLPDEKSIVHIDTERTLNDCYKGLQRIAKRVDIETNPELVTDGKFTGVHFQCFITIPTVANKKKAIEELVKTHNPGLLIIDGITDLVASVNDEAESSELLSWLASMANENDFGILATIHPNPKEDTRKPRGHIGSEGNRKCESMLLLTRATDDRNIRLLTSNFDYGKNRNGIDTIETAFSWNNDLGMFSSIDYTPPDNSSTINYGTRFNEILGSGSMSYTPMAEAYTKKYRVSLPTAKRHIKEASEINVLQKAGNKYQIKNDHYEGYSHDCGF